MGEERREKQLGKKNVYKGPGLQGTVLRTERRQSVGRANSLGRMDRVMLKGRQEPGLLGTEDHGMESVFISRAVGGH